MNTLIDMTTKQVLLKDAESILTKTYSKPPILFTRGEGCYLFDSDGNRYLDFTAGIAVSALGYCHPEMVKVIQEQAAALIHTSNMFAHPWEILLAKKLVSSSFAKRVFFTSSGTEANEGALKAARLYAAKTYKSKRFEFVSTLDAFHGRSMGSLSVTGREKYRKDFEPLIPGVKFIRYNDCDALEKALTDTVCGFIVEPIQGEAGVFPAADEFLKLARRLTTERDIIFILDEVQVGVGRTGRLFGYEHFEIEPDIMTLAKGLGGGFPIGAILFNQKTADLLQVGHHGSTYGGNPLGCRTALSVLETIEKQHLVENAAEMGRYAEQKLREVSQATGKIKNIRGKGLLIGVELTVDATQIFVKLREEERILVNRILPNILRIIPPLIIAKKEIDQLASALRRCLEQA